MSRARDQSRRVASAESQAQTMARQLAKTQAELEASRGREREQRRRGDTALQLLEEERAKGRRRSADEVLLARLRSAEGELQGWRKNAQMWLDRANRPLHVIASERLRGWWARQIRKDFPA